MRWVEESASRKEYRLDLLFYPVHLHCYVVIDLKMGELEPQHSGQMSFYVAAVDNLLRTTLRPSASFSARARIEQRQSMRSRCRATGCGTTCRSRLRSSWRGG